MIEGILFDKDGTLLDFNGTWLDPYLKVSEYLANSVGRPELAEILLRKGGFIPETSGWVCDSLLASGSNDQIFDFWSEEIGERIEGQRLFHIRSIFSHAADNYVPAVENIGKFLGGLKNRNIRLGLATMDDEGNAMGMIERLCLDGIFDFVCGGNSGFGVKPEPGMVKGFCDQCRISAKNVVMVGDSPKDMNMGKNAGVACSVGVLTGAHGAAELEPYADIVIPNILGLEQLLDQQL